MQSNLVKRTITGVLFIILLVGCILYSPLSFGLLFTLIAALSVHEFGHLVNAFQYGAPPHGGLAYGLDRLVMLMTGASSIRDVIAFPKVQNASDLMMNCPDVVDDKQLDDLSIAVTRMEETPAEDEV